MPQTIVYEGDADIAALGLFKELLREDRWTPGDWYVEIDHDGLWEGDKMVVWTSTNGHLLAVRDMVPNEDGHGYHGEVDIEPWDTDADVSTGPVVTIVTDEIVKVVVT